MTEEIAGLLKSGSPFSITVSRRNAADAGDVGAPFEELPGLALIKANQAAGSIEKS